MTAKSTRQAPPPVVNTNPVRPARPARPAPPDEPTHDPIPEPRPTPTEPPTPGPTPATTPGPAVQPSAVARPDGRGDLIAGLLANNNTSTPSTHPTSDAASMLLNLAAMRMQQVDPMNDYTGDGTRMLRWIQAAIAHYASMTGKTQQDIVRDALLGITPLPAELLDAHYQLTYQRPRP